MYNLIKLQGYGGEEFYGIVIDYYREKYYDDYTGDYEFVLAIVRWTDGSTTAEEWVLGSTYYRYVDGEWIAISSEQEWMEFLCQLRQET